jgi:hypothetical protein
MKRNLGLFERLFRALLGAIALVLALGSPSLGVSEGIVVVLGVFLLLNALTGRCYLWKLLGLNSAKDSSCGLDDNYGS